jgi:AraC-like DNA-binding protein
MPLSAKLLASGTGWRVSGVICTSGPRDPCYVEQHSAYSIALVTNGNFKLRRSSDAIAAVALACGFGDLSTFNRPFRRAMGRTPGAYRSRRESLR